MNLNNILSQGKERLKSSLECLNPKGRMSGISQKARKLWEGRSGYGVPRVPEFTTSSQELVAALTSGSDWPWP